ncbi:serine protease 27-like [Poeciliopsis prolifica]|uniref:serine protease 27-like n=1 Tax=Poeciliopsis prolifica TaxID=188132 RepID=UPI0024146303|nr:serine protease 27-like [Poeciliopsis prolifica]
MALQGFAWGITVMIALFFKGGDSQHACARPPNNSSIIGGQSASAGRWPWHVTFTLNGNVQWQGSLITDEWVLTTAQYSVYYYNYEGQNNSGSYYNNDVVMYFGAINQSGFGEVTRRIANFTCNQDYAYYGGNDICLVKLSAPVNFTDYIRPVCLAAENSTFHNGTSSWVTGFSGTLGSIKEIDVSVIGIRKCNCSYNNNYYFYYHYFYRITETVMCAGNEDVSKRTSYRDEGAALVTKKDSIWVQSGILSKAWLSEIGVYTRVSLYQKWITDRVTGMKPGFVTYTSRGIDSDLTYTCPSPATTTVYPYYTRAPTTDDSIFASGESLIAFARVFPLSALVLFLHLFVGGAGN